MDNKILEKIQRLLALSTSSNVNEAAVAAAKAQELMTKYQIELADVQATTPGFKPASIENEVLAVEKSLIHWKTQLAVALAEANGCKVYVSRLRGAEARVETRFIGTRAALSTVSYMYAYLVREVDRLASLNREGHDRTWLQAFRFGAASTIGARIVQASKETKSHATGAALAVIDKDAERVNEVFASMTLKKGSKPTIRDRDGYIQGVEAGKSVKLSSGPALGKGTRGDLKD